MVGGRGQGADAVITSGQAILNGGSQDTINGNLVHALEEHENLGIHGLCGAEIFTHVLDRDMGVAHDVAALEVLWCGVVGVVGVGEGARIEVRDGHFYVEVGICGDVVTGLRADDNLGDHVVLRRDVAHG